MGENPGAYRDLALSFFEWNGRPHRALDILTAFPKEDGAASEPPYHNADFLWPVVMYLTTYLRRRGFSAEYVSLPHLSGDELRLKLQTSAVRAIAITTTLYVLPLPIIELFKRCRRLNPWVPVIVGGPFLSSLASSLQQIELASSIAYIGADIYVLCHEGEATLAATLCALKEGTPLLAVPNLVPASLAGDTH